MLCRTALLLWGVGGSDRTATPCRFRGGAVFAERHASTRFGLDTGAGSRAEPAGPADREGREGAGGKPAGGTSFTYRIEGRADHEITSERVNPRQPTEAADRDHMVRRLPPHRRALGVRSGRSGLPLLRRRGPETAIPDTDRSKATGAGVSEAVSSRESRAACTRQPRGDALTAGAAANRPTS